MILGEEPVTLIRYPATSWGADGRSTVGAAVSSTILASVQPLGGREIALLPESERHAEHLKAYTVTELRTADQYTSTLADRIVVDGITYEVQKVERQRSVIPHYKVTLVRFQEIDPS